jgi:hypothetical protein
VQLKIDENVAEKVIPADDSVRLLDQIAFYFATAPYAHRLFDLYLSSLVDTKNDFRVFEFLTGRHLDVFRHASRKPCTI